MQATCRFRTRQHVLLHCIDKLLQALRARASLLGLGHSLAQVDDGPQRLYERRVEQLPALAELCRLAPARVCPFSCTKDLIL